MSTLNSPRKGLFFVSVIYQEDYPIEEFLNSWRARYGEGELFLPDFNPSFKYYSKEMGESLKRLIFFSFDHQLREDLVDAKLWATDWENKHLVNGARTINCDPGLLTLENMVLATGKPFGHRIYLGKGIYADLNYIYQKAAYQILPWTYPDYGHPEKLVKFEEVRQKFLLK